MIERIRIDDDVEKYTVEIGAGEVVVIMALNGVIKVMEPDAELAKAVLNQYETWTASNSANSFKIGRAHV